MKDLHFLHQPLLPSTVGTVSGIGTFTTSAAALDNSNTIAMSSTQSIIFRLLSVLLIGLISIFANHEASKGFDLTIVNDAGDTPAGRRFDLLFVSNDKVSRLVLNANQLVQNILYSQDNNLKNSIRRVTVRFTAQSIAQIVTVHFNHRHEFLININSSVMEEHDISLAMTRIIEQAMARIWLWNIRHDHKKSYLIKSIVECVTMLSGSHAGDPDSMSLSPEYSIVNWWEEKDVRRVAKILHYCEGKEKGFIGRLNQALRDMVEDQTVEDDDMGSKRVEYVCGSCNATNLSLSNY